MTNQKTLADLTRGESATIGAITAPPTLRLRLQELGFTPGSSVSMIQRSAFGGALAFRLRGALVALRKSDSLCVEALP